MPKYVPILRSKPAEIWAWGHATQTALGNSRVFFEIDPTTSAKTPLEDFASRLARNWPAGSVVTVDSGRFNGANGGVRQLAQALQRHQIPERPVVHLDDPPPVLAEVADACALHGQGACLRLGSEDQDPDPRVPKHQVATMLAEIGLGTQNIDLLIDFKVIASTRDVTRCTPLAIAMLSWAASNGPWRSVTLASGAFPRSVSGLQLGAPTPLTRYDAILFADVLSAGPEIEPDYGDYGINYPIIAPAPPRQPNPNLRYTDSLAWWVYREARTRPGNESFFTACANVVQSACWAGPGFSAGDIEIERCSRSEGSPGAATQWLQYGASHHIATVVHRLATLGVP